MSKRSLDSILEGFNPNEYTSGGGALNASICICVPAEYKQAFDRLQAKSRKQFCKTIRELIVAAIDRADSQA